MEIIDYADAPVRIATETIEHEIDGVNTVIAQEGQPVPLAFAHLVDDDLTVASEQEYIQTRSTTGRRRAQAARAEGDAGTDAGGEPAEGPLLDPGSFNVDDVLEAFAGATPEEIAEAQAREAAGKNRKGIVEYEPEAAGDDGQGDDGE